MKLVSLIFYLLFFGFLVFFIASLDKDYDYDNSNIVVFTGEGNRIKEGLFLSNKLHSKILISGVNSHISKKIILNVFYNNNYFDNNNIFLDYKSKNTIENAIQTVKWIEKNKLKKIVLVTNYYHMLRSVKNIKLLNKDIQIYKHPVKSKRSFLKLFQIYLKEYFKFLFMFLY